MKTLEIKEMLVLATYRKEFIIKLLTKHLQPLTYEEKSK